MRRRKCILRFNSGIGKFKTTKTALVQALWLMLYYHLECPLLWLQMNHTLGDLIQTSCPVYGM